MNRSFYGWLEERLHGVYGECRCPLKHASPFQLMVAVVLSAQCRDDRVNLVTEKLFAIAPDASSMAKLTEERIEEIIRPCGLGKAKAKSIRAASRMLLDDFGGEVPRDMDKLLKLPGVGRKSANVLLGNAFGIPGFPVDTHVKRIIGRLDPAAGSTPEEIERYVTARVAPEKWTNLSHMIIFHGRAICSAAKPNCGECVLAEKCKSRR
ncbi:MAG: endonuclease III [Victivallaceae bacterium]|nr:endonuclease III [Victivallaceae bacterium]